MTGVQTCALPIWFRAVTVADYTLIANTTVNVKGTDASYTINAITAAASAEVTTTASHGLTTGDTVTIEGSNSTPVIDGTRVVTVVSATKFTVPVNTSGAGTAGTVYAGRLDATTMPLKLVRTGATTFTLDAIAWNQRTSGNTTTNPLPPFWTSGGTYAIAGACERMVQHLRDHTGIEPYCVMTGGAGWKMAPSMAIQFELVDSLIFDGLLKLAQARFE